MRPSVSRGGRRTHGTDVPIQTARLADHRRRLARSRGRDRPARRARSRRESRIESPGSAAHVGRPADRRNRPLRVRQSRQREERHPHQQLDPVRGIRRRSELLHVRTRRSLRHQHRQQRRCEAGHHLPVGLPQPVQEPEDLPVQHRSRLVAERRDAELHAALHIDGDTGDAYDDPRA